MTISRILKSLLFSVLASGCAASLYAYDQFFETSTSMYFGETEDPYTFLYFDSDLEEVTSLGVFDDCVQIGALKFNATQRRPSDFYRYGRKVGADVVVTSIVRTPDVQVSGSTTVYDAEVSTVYDASGALIGTISKQVPRAVPYERLEERYDYEVIFYKESSDGKSNLWNRTVEDYSYRAATSESKPFEGQWTNGLIVVNFRTNSSGRLIGIVEAISEDEREEIGKENWFLTGNYSNPWDPGDVALVIDLGVMFGYWVDRTKTPQACRFSIGKDKLLRGTCTGRNIAFRKISQ